MAVSVEEFEDLEAFKEHVRAERKGYKTAYKSAYDKFIAPLLDDMMEDLEEFVEATGEEAMHDEELEFDNEEDE